MSEDKVQGNQYCPGDGGRGRSGEGLLPDFQYQYVIQVSRFACAFGPASERHLKIAALFLSSPSFFHPMLSRLSTQRNHYACMAQWRAALTYLTFFRSRWRTAG